MEKDKYCGKTKENRHQCHNITFCRGRKIQLPI